MNNDHERIEDVGIEWKDEEQKVAEPESTGAESVVEQPKSHQVKDIKAMLVRVFADLRKGISPNTAMNAALSVGCLVNFEHCIRTLLMCKFAEHDNQLLDDYLAHAVRIYGESIKHEMVKFNSIPIRTIKSAKNLAKKQVQRERRTGKR